MDGELELVLCGCAVNEIVIYDAAWEVLLALTRVLQVFFTVRDIEIVAYLHDTSLALLDPLDWIHQKLNLSKRTVVLQVTGSEQVIP